MKILIAPRPPAGRFSDWLRPFCTEHGVPISRLHILFVRAGGVCNEKTLRRWVAGANDPPELAVRTLLRALDSALEDVDVYDSYKEWSQMS